MGLNEDTCLYVRRPTLKIEIQVNVYTRAGKDVFNCPRTRFLPTHFTVCLNRDELWQNIMRAWAYDRQRRKANHCGLLRQILANGLELF